MPDAYIALGSNVGDKEVHLSAAIEVLGGAGTVKRVSRFHVTAPVGYLDQDDFLNAAVLLETAMTPGALLEFLLELERAAGRVRTVKNGPRTLDLDILLYGALVIDEPGLTIPHPRLHERMFVLEPLCEIAPDVMHPVLKKTMAQLKSALMS